MNRFLIIESFAIGSEDFCFAGEIVEGIAVSGMVFKVPEGGHKWKLSIKAVGFIRKSGGRELFCLKVQNANYLNGLGVGWTAELKTEQHDAQPSVQADRP